MVNIVQPFTTMDAIMDQLDQCCETQNVTDGTKHLLRSLFNALREKIQSGIFGTLQEARSAVTEVLAAGQIKGNAEATTVLNTLLDQLRGTSTDERGAEELAKDEPLKPEEWNDWMSAPTYDGPEHRKNLRAPAFPFPHSSYN